MDVYFSNGYGILLMLWGLVFEIAGAYAMWMIYRWNQSDQRSMSEVADAALRAQPAPLPKRSVQPVEPREEPRRAA